MSDFVIRIRLHDDDGTPGRVLPTQKIEVADVESSSPVLRFALSAKTAGLVQAPQVIGIEYGTGGDFVSPRNNLFLAKEDESDESDESKTISFVGTGYVPWLLNKNQLGASTNVKNGERTWIDQSPARPVLSMILEAQDRGWAPWVDRDWTSTHDSNGVAWTSGDMVDEQSFPLGQLAWPTLEQGSAQGLYEWWTEGTTLRVFRPGTGIDRTSVVTLGGKGFTRAPIKSTADDLFTHLTVVGDKLKTPVTIANPGSVTRFGRLEASMTQSGIKTVGTATRLAQPSLVDGRSVKREYSFSWNPNPDSVRPWTHFNIGDLVKVRTRTGRENHRVLGITVVQGSSGGATVTVTTGSKILTQAAKTIRRVGGASAGSITGGSGKLVPSTPGVASAEPAIPTGLSVVSNVGYFGDDGTARARVTLEWTEVTTSTDGDALTIGEYELRHRLDSTPTGWRVSSAVDDRIVIDTWESGVARVVKIRARSQAGVWGEFSTDLTVTPAFPTDVPDVPTAPVATSSKATVTGTWDGLLTTGAPAAGWKHCILEAALGGSGVWVQVGVLERGGLTFPASLVGAVLGDDVDLRLFAVDTIGQVSTPSTVTTVTVVGIVGDDVEYDTIGANNLDAGAVQARHMAVGVGATGQRVEITGAGLRVFDPDDNPVVSIGTASDDLLSVAQKNDEGDMVVVASIDEDGEGTLQSLALSTEATVQGVDLIGTVASDPQNGFDLGEIPMLDRFGRGLVSEALIGSASYSGVTHEFASLAIGSVELLAHRVYQVRITGPTAQSWITDGSAGNLFIQCYVGTGAQSVTSPNNTNGANSSCVVLRSNASIGTGVQEVFNFRAFSPAVSGQFNLLVRLRNDSDRQWSFVPDLVASNPTRVEVWDVGASASQWESESWSSRATSGSVTPPAAKKTLEVAAAWSVLWGPSGFIRPASGNLYDDGRMLQGGGASIGDGRAGRVGFPALGLAGKTPLGMAVLLKARHTGGSSAVIDLGTHGNASAPTSGSSPNSSNTWTARFKPGEQRWVQIPPGLWGGFMSGTYRGIQVGGPDVNTGSSDYAILDGYSTTNAASSNGLRPRLKVSYR